MRAPLNPDFLPGARALPCEDASTSRSSFSALAAALSTWLASGSSKLGTGGGVSF